MAKIFLGLGSNINPRDHIMQALVALQQKFGELALSPTYESEAVGFDGDNFLNLVVSTHTKRSVGELHTLLKEIEDATGRNRSSPKFSGRTLDIDILLYDDKQGLVDEVPLPRDEILKNAFVLKPLSDLSPNTIHPLTKKPYKQLWLEYDQSKQKLWPANLAE